MASGIYKKGDFMGDTLSDYLHIAAGTIIFASAIALFLSYMGILGVMNKAGIEDMNVRSSVTMDTETGYSGDVIYVKGSEVYADILSLGDGIEVTLNGHAVDMEKIKMNDSGAKKDVYDDIDMNADYIISHKYYSNNEIKAVSYTHS